MNKTRTYAPTLEELLADPCPCCLWDGIDGRIYWANEAGLKFWGAEDAGELRERSFDHAMPALRRLRKLATSELPPSGWEERFVFWTPTGTKQINCNCIKLEVQGYGELLLLRMRDARDGELPAPQLSADAGNPPAIIDDTIAPRGEQNVDRHHEEGDDFTSRDDANRPEPNPIGDGADDVAATLREIARQVRAESRFNEGADSAKSEHADDAAGAAENLSQIGATDEMDNASGTGQNNADPSGNDLASSQNSPVENVEFLAKVSHEVRTPLNAILGFSELMMQERLGALNNKKYAEYISDIHHSAELALSLINDMLDLSRARAGNFDDEIEDIDLNDVAAKMLGIIWPQAEKNSIELKIELKPGELPIRAGMRSVKQILLNILSNAIKFSPASGEVKLTTRLCSDDRAIVEISDAGCGMTSDEIERVLQPYVRLQDGDREIEGTGLGLPITRALADANGGTFRLESTPGEGTTASVSFPVAK